MNRKTRRSERKVRTSAAAAAPIPAPLLALARSHYADGRLGEADALCARHLLVRPDDVVALHMRGQIASLQQRPADAVSHLAKALAVAPDAAALHAGLAQAYRAAGQPVEAELHYRRVAQLQPGAVTHLNLANALTDLQRPEEAAKAYRLALRFNPRLPEAHYGLGIALAALGDDQAAGAFADAIASRPDFTRAHEGLIAVHQALYAYDAALQAASRAVVRSDTPELRLVFIDCARDALSPQDTPELREALRRALAERWTRPQDLAPVICSVAAQGEAIKAAEEPLSSLLTLAPIRHRDVEATLTRQRLKHLEAVRSGTALSASDLACACRLARQCFINEYAWHLSTEEVGEVEALHAEVQATLDRQVSPSDMLLAVLAMYVPLASLAGTETLVVSGRPPELAAVLEQQVLEPAEEQRMRHAIQRATPIDDVTSQAVREQYESNPYPRWVATLAISRQVSLGDWLEARFGIPPGSFPSGRTLDVLVAGCGTGQHAVETVQALSDVNVLAIDLSLASLGFAARITTALGVASIEYRQADLLEAARIGRTFDMIGVGGVLHHLADPWAGWRALLATLRPRGVMNVLLYTVRGRTDVRAARDWIATRGYEPTASGIRTCRNVLMTLDEDWARRLAASPDFASLSGCRDLLFHVQETAVTLPEVAGFLAEGAIDLLGVEVPAATQRAFRAWSGSDDAPLRDLSRWDLFEAEHPRCFAGMLNLWVQAR